MTTIPEVFQKAIEAHEESEREREYWEREKKKKYVAKLTRELRALGLETPDGLEIPNVTIEDVEFMLTGNDENGYEVSAHVYTWEDSLVWRRIYGLARLGEVLKEHYAVLNAPSESA